MSIEHRKIFGVGTEENMTRLALINPGEIEARLQARETTLAKLRAVAP